MSLDRFARLLAGASAPLLPAWAVVTAVHPRLRPDWRARWGLQVAPTRPGATWVHASSLGEVRAAAGLLSVLEGPVLLTTDTSTGLSAAREVAGPHGGRVVAAIRPVDHPWTLAPLWSEARPTAVVLVESAWWPQLVALAGRSDVPVLRASARPGRGSARWQPLWRRLGDGVQATAAQDADAAAWYARFGGTAAVAGDLKLASPLPEGVLRWHRPFVVAASTRAGDEARLLALDLRVGLLLAPREPARFAEVAALLRGRRWARRSALGAEVPPDLDVVLLDTLGELAGCFAGARAAFIGGTFDPSLGGHSAAEAARAGVPVVSGPHWWANAESFRRATHFVAAEDDLGRVLAEATAAEARPVVQPVAEQTRAALLPWLKGPAAPPAPPRPWATGLQPLWRRASKGGQGSERLPVPVVAVGSPDARGPGRTSSTRLLAEVARAQGHRVGVVVRGYGRGIGRQGIFLSRKTPDAHHLGDEGALFAADGHLVAAGADRVAAGHALVAEGATLVLYDDGLPCPVYADRRVLVVDARDPDAGGLLPAGWRRREVPEAIDLVLAHHADDPVAVPLPTEWVAVERTLGPWHRGERVCEPPPGPVALFTGVSRPGDVVGGIDLPVTRTWVLRDHETPDAGTLIAWAGGLPLVCTEKDRVRLPAQVAASVWWRPLVLRVDDARAPDLEGVVRPRLTG